MTRSPAVQSRIDPLDHDRIAAAVRFVGTQDTDSVLARLLPRLSEAERVAIASRCRFAHAAVLVFPPDLAALDDVLAAHDLTIASDDPSVVVRQRLAARHGLDPQRVPVRIVRAALPAADGTPCAIEIFALPGAPVAVAAAERAGENEAHIALATGPVDPVTLAGLRALLTGPGGLRPDHGGYNDREDATSFYFRRPGARTDKRVELYVEGAHPGELACHTSESTDPATRLLGLFTGAWATQALAVTARSGIADRLAATPGAPLDELAAVTGTHLDALGRLLRYLAQLEVVEPLGDGYALTETGALLVADAQPSLHPLACLYGGAFYESFGELGYAVRTGRTAFDHHFGLHHFDYFRADPERASLFDRAMAASASIFGQVAGLVGAATARTVVDVGGGSGELLARVVAANSQLRGILFERDTTLPRARATLTAAGCLSRCELVAGDFFTAEVPTGGDIYLLSRVLHDWDDADCRTILRGCAAAMSEHARLYLVERLLPEDGSDSLTPAWDLHMLCNVGGRERTLTHYRAVLRSAGLELIGHDDLPLGFALLGARRAG
ncbi:methyltransferase [Nocardia asteroides]|uniref:methyltransferase n=1 Tax=Nocardia asteroides TaxID=1824 RepID=UPI0033E68667